MQKPYILTPNSLVVQNHNSFGKLSTMGSKVTFKFLQMAPMSILKFLEVVNEGIDVLLCPTLLNLWS